MMKVTRQTTKEEIADALKQVAQQLVNDGFPCRLEIKILPATKPGAWPRVVVAFALWDGNRDYIYKEHEGLLPVHEEEGPGLFTGTPEQAAEMIDEGLPTVDVETGEVMEAGKELKRDDTEVGKALKNLKKTLGKGNTMQITTPDDPEGVTIRGE
jgi:hypothetical protein